jgi:putative ABC transport system permease protein
VDDELDGLIANRVEHLVARGVPPDEARREAIRRLGMSLDNARQQLRSSAERRERRVHLHEHLENFLQDFRYAARGLARRPGFTVVAVLTLAIGIGATTAIFSVVDALLIRPLPYERSNELMTISLIMPRRGDRPSRDMVWSYPKFALFRNEQRVFSTLALYGSNLFTVRINDVERLTGEYVSASYLRTLGLRVARGRDFDLSEDAHFDAPRQVLLSYQFWQRELNGDPSIIGRTIDVNSNPFDVIGVAPPGFRGLTGESELFVPIAVNRAEDQSPQSHSYFLVARLARGVAPSTAAAATRILGTRINDAYPNPVDHDKWGATAHPLDDERVAPVVKQSLLVLLGAVALVLFIACVNVANLLLGRAHARSREIAVRLAVGAGRARLVRLLLIESLMVAGLGALASMAVAWFGVRGLAMADPAKALSVTRATAIGAGALESIALNWTALGFTLIVGVTVGVMFGLVPALSATKASVTGALKSDRSEREPAGLFLPGRRALIVSEIVLALVLLSGAGLMIRSLEKLVAVDTGFDPTNVLTARLVAARPAVASDSLPIFTTELVHRLENLPSVVSAAIGNCLPLSGGCNTTSIQFPEHPEVDLAHSPSVSVDWASPSWFGVLRIPLKHGRLFTTADRVGTEKVVVVNETAAKRFWPNEDPVGKRLSIGMGGVEDATVIGVVGDVRRRADSVAMAGVYVPLLQSPRAGLIAVVRARSNAAAVGTDVRRVIRELSPRSPVYDMQTMTQRTAEAMALAKFCAELLALFAATALALAAIGIYGVISLAVTARTREIGIRIALGANRGRVQRLVVGEGALLLAIGVIVGLAGALAGGRVLRTLLFDLSPSDPTTYVAAVAVLSGIALAASWLPARRASRVDPLVALRAD